MKGSFSLAEVKQAIAHPKLFDFLINVSNLFLSQQVSCARYGPLLDLSMPS